MFPIFAKLTYQGFSSVSSCELPGCKEGQGGLEGCFPCPGLCVNSIGNTLVCIFPAYAHVMV